MESVPAQGRTWDHARVSAFGIAGSGRSDWSTALLLFERRARLVREATQRVRGCRMRRSELEGAPAMLLH